MYAAISEAAWQRYHGNKPDARYVCWTPAAPLAVMARDRTLVIILPEPASVHIGTNGWQGVHDIATEPGSPGAPGAGAISALP